MTFVGVDGCPDGWLAVEYSETGFEGATAVSDVGDLWKIYRDAETILIDMPIGLREDSGEPRPCDVAARERLGSPRSSSVFPTPVRSALDAESYAEARDRQEARTDRSIGAQTWGLADKLREVDAFMRTHDAAVGTVREAHPELCFWALNDGQATEYSKTGRPIAGFWERIEILERVDDAICRDVRAAGTDLVTEGSNDDLLDAFVLAVAASPLTGELRSLPAEWPDGDPGDPAGLPIEIVYPRSL
jgi:predicted RNase H-like nuclease